MGDIKRNEGEKVVEKRGKEVELNLTKKPGVELQRGNLDLVMIRLLEAINKNMVLILNKMNDKGK